MQIKLSESDIRAGIALYLTSRGITGVTAENLQATFTAGRKGAGLTADVTTGPVLQVTLKDEAGNDRVKATVKAEQLVVEPVVEEAKQPVAEPTPEAPAEEPAPKAVEPAPVAEEAKPAAPEEGASLFS